MLVIERLGEPFSGRILRADLSACGVIDVYNGFSARRGDRRAVVCDVIGIRRDAAIRRSDCGDATAHIVGIRRGIAARVGLRRQPAHAVIGIGGGERRPAVCGDGDRPQIRAVIIIHCLRGIVKRNIRISALFRQSALFVIGIRRPRRENVIDVGAGLGDGFAVLGEQIFKPDRRIRILLICGGQRKVGI